MLPAHYREANRAVSRAILGIASGGFNLINDILSRLESTLKQIIKEGTYQ
jgi:hypothetical protein